MEKRLDSSLFVNDGSFMERFKQIQQEKENNGALKESKTGTALSGSPAPKIVISKPNINDKRKAALAASSGKLAFSLRQKSKPVAPAVKLGEDEEEDEANAGNMSGDGPTKRQKLGGQPDSTEKSSQQVDVAPPAPSDPAVKIVADKLASFVAKNGRQFEDVTRQKNPGDTPFKFLFDEGCADYKYYEYCLNEEEKALSQSGGLQPSHSGGTSTSTAKSTGSSQKSHQHHSNYQTPASALYDSLDTGAASSGVTVNGT